MTETLSFVQDPTFRLWYVAGGLVLLAGPMIWLAIWYHANIGKSAGGRALMRRQNRNRPLARSVGGLGDAAGMGRDIAAGKYGDDARRMQTRVYWIAGLWVVALIVYFGFLIWADEITRATPAG